MSNGAPFWATQHPIEPGRTLTELRRTLLSHAEPWLSYAAPWIIAIYCTYCLLLHYASYLSSCQASLVLRILFSSHPPSTPHPTHPNKDWLYLIPLPLSICSPEAEFMNVQFCWGFRRKSWEFSDLSFLCGFLKPYRKGMVFNQVFLLSPLQKL